MKQMLKNLFSSIKRHYALYKGGNVYLDYLRNKGIVIGNNVSVSHPRTIKIDMSRPYLIEIGDNVRLNMDLTIMTHDWATMVFKKKYGELLPCSGKVKIGNNVYFGRQCTVLKGVTIGDNCIIGFGSIVMKDIPSNSIAVGRPAKVICSLEDYYNKRTKQSLEEALALAKEIQLTQHRRPVTTDFREEFVFFVSGHQIDNYPELPIENQLRVDADCFDVWRKNHKAPFNNFDEFLAAAGIE